MDFYCCFSLITHQNCQVCVSLECIVHRGLCWHGFVMRAATDQQNSVPFEAHEVQ